MSALNQAPGGQADEVRRASVPLVEVVYRPQGGWARHRQLWRQMLRDLAASPAIARQLLRQRLLADYRQSLLGGLLAFMPALGLLLWATLAQRAAILNPQGVAIPYPAYVLLGIVVWFTFAEAIRVQVEGLERERGTLAKVDLPPEAMVVAGIGRVLFDLLAKLLLVALVFLVFGIGVSGTLLLAPLPLAVLVVLGTALGLLLAPLNALYQDVGKSLQAVLVFWFFMTPILYPTPRQGVFHWLVTLNPVAPLLTATRDLAIGGAELSPWGLAISTGMAIVGLPVAWFFYRLAMPVVLERGA